MGISPALRSLLSDTLQSFQPGIAIESGTYNGLGSTTLLAELFQELNPQHPPRIFTLEVSFAHWQSAARNLKKYRHVRPLWGLSVKTEEARRFIQQDPALNHHETEPDIYIDNIDDPVAFYTDEIDGKLIDPSAIPSPYVKRILYREGLLPRLLKRYGTKRPLILLDSAGAIGFLEFSVVRELMRDLPDLLLLDDIDHLKHYRSRRAIKADPYFQVLGEAPETGWLLAQHNPALGA
jgi:hypothetical protein